MSRLVILAASVFYISISCGKTDTKINKGKTFHRPYPSTVVGVGKYAVRLFRKFEDVWSFRKFEDVWSKL